MFKNKHAETEETKDRIYKYVSAHSNVTMPELVRELGISKGQAMHALKFLTYRNHISKSIVQTKNGRFAQYNKDRVQFIKQVNIKIERVKNEFILELAPQAKAVAKVYRLLDRAPSKQPKEKSRSNSRVYGMQSSMQMFGNW